MSGYLVGAMLCAVFGWEMLRCAVKRADKLDFGAGLIFLLVSLSLFSGPFWRLM